MRINRTLIGVILVLSTTINSCIPKTQPEQINVLWLVAEDLSSMYLSMYGDSSAFTPNLNRLADEEHTLPTQSDASPRSRGTASLRGGREVCLG